MPWQAAHSSERILGDEQVCIVREVDFGRRYRGRGMRDRLWSRERGLKNDYFFSAIVTGWLLVMLVEIPGRNRLVQWLRGGNKVADVLDNSND